MKASMQVSMKYRGFKQVFKGLRTIQFDDGDIVEFLEGPAFIVKSADTLPSATPPQCPIPAITTRFCDLHRP